MVRSLTRKAQFGREVGGNRQAPARAALNHALFAVLPVLLTLDLIYVSFHRGHIDAYDFNSEFWPAAHRVLHGLSLYDRSWMNIPKWVAFPYPAFTAVVFVPLALVNHASADLIFTVVSIVSALLTLRVMEVRDWRLYGLTLMLSPVVIAWQSANVTLVLGLAMACMWRYRNSPVVAGALLAAMISLKPFVWPLALWLLATGRYRAVAYGAVCGLALNAASWAIVGFNQVHSYMTVVSAVNAVMDRRGYSIISLMTQLGAGRGLAYAVGIAATIVVAATLVVVGRRGNDSAAFTIGVATCLLVTPVLWSHYLALAIVPLALLRPRLDVTWLLLLAIWACPVNRPELWQLLLAIGTITITFVLLLRTPRGPEPEVCDALNSAVNSAEVVAVVHGRS